MDSIGYGTAVHWDNPAGSLNFIRIGKVKNIAWGGPERDAVDKSTQDTPEGWRQWRKGMKDATSISFTVAQDMDDPTHDANTGLYSDFYEDRINHNWRIIANDGVRTTTFQFEGLCKSMPSKYPEAGMIEADVTVKLSGKPTIATV